MNTHTRVEKDSFGEIEVPIDALYGAQTARSLVYFAIGQDVMPSSLIRSYALLKKIAAQVNGDLGLLDDKRVRYIGNACDEILQGKWSEQFPLSIWQTGSGTQTNMNLNEVIAHRAAMIAHEALEPQDFKIHQNDHVNCSQSSNDTFPTAMYMAAVTQIHTTLLPALLLLEQALFQKQQAFKDIVKIGRTHLQDATPLTLGQEFSGYSALVSRSIKRIEQTLIGLYDLALGGTAVGTGINAPPEFADRFIQKLVQETQLPFRSHPNKFAALSAHDELVFASGALATTACSLMKIANDIRYLASGPYCGLGELKLPQNEPGSSIMPGKVNPTQCEAVTMVCTQVIGNHTAIMMGGSQGHFELNTFKPVMIHNFLHSVELLSDVARSFTEYCVRGIEANTKQIQKHLNASLMLVTALSPVIGYDRASTIAKKAYQEEITLKEACLKLSYLSEAEYDKIVDPRKMIGS